MGFMLSLQVVRKKLNALNAHIAGENHLTDAYLLILMRVFGTATIVAGVVA